MAMARPSARGPLAGLLLAVLAGFALADDMAVVRGRLLSLLCMPPPSQLPGVVAQAARYEAHLLPNGTWPDIDYNDPGDRAVWKTAQHLSRVTSMAQAVSAGAGGPSLVNATRLALGWWSRVDPQNVNWWWDIISVPQTYSNVYLLLGVAPLAQAAGFPSPEELDAGLRDMFRAAWWNASLGYEASGANLAWMLQAQLVRGVLPFLPNASALDEGFAKLWSSAVVVNRSTGYAAAQGVQWDASYQFHGPQLQIASYGQDFSGEMLLMEEVTAGTQWAPPPGALSVLCAYWALGNAWLSVGPAYDWTAAGRQVSRPGESAEFGVTLNTTRIAAAAAACPDPAQGALVADWAARVAGTVPPPPPLVGSRAFFASDALAHRRPAWAAVLHSHSTRTAVPECGNGENLLGRYMGEGVLSVYGTACGNGSNGLPRGCGLEYADVFPLFDWELIPGTTVPAGAPFPGCDGACCWVKQVESRPFVGAATDGVRVAVAGMDTAIAHLAARRAFFFFDDGVAVLAAGATDAGGGAAQTALAQQWLVDAHVSVGFRNGSVAALPDGNYSLPDAAWLHADGTGWVPLVDALGPGSAAAPALSSGMRYGNWDVIGPSNLSASGRTIAVSLQHGALPVAGGAAWGWAVLPNISAAAMPAAAAAGGLGLTVAANSPAVQAVANASGGSAAAVFWPPPGACSNGTAPSGTCAGGNVTFSVGSVRSRAGLLFGAAPLSVAVSRPCFVTLSEDAGAGTVRVAVSNPDTPGGLEVDVTLNRVLSGAAPGCNVVAAGGGGSSGSTTLRFVLPSSALEDMGAPAVQTCSL